MAPFKGGFDPRSNYPQKKFAQRLSFSNGHPNQRNAKTAVSATGKNLVAKKKSDHGCGNMG